MMKKKILPLALIAAVAGWGLFPPSGQAAPVVGNRPHRADGTLITAPPATPKRQPRPLPSVEAVQTTGRRPSNVQPITSAGKTPATPSKPSIVQPTQPSGKTPSSPPALKKAPPKFPPPQKTPGRASKPSVVQPTQQANKTVTSSGGTTLSAEPAATASKPAAAAPKPSSATTKAAAKPAAAATTPKPAASKPAATTTAPKPAPKPATAAPKPAAKPATTASKPVTVKPAAAATTPKPAASKPAAATAAPKPAAAKPTVPTTTPNPAPAKTTAAPKHPVQWEKKRTASKDNRSAATAKAKPAAKLKDVYKQGDHAWMVLKAQSYLEELGYHPGAQNGDFTKGTRKALKKFQKKERDEGIRRDGKLDMETFQLLKRRAAEKKYGTEYMSADSKSILRTAARYKGTRYVFGGTSPKGFDCSGYVQYVFAQHGIRLSRTADTQAKEGVFVSRSKLRPGDLVFFTTYAPGASHNGIYAGNGKFWNATSHGVMLSDMNDSYWSSRYYTGRRILSGKGKK
jgi:cell wall-associated NlpC family hydrolase